LKSTLTAKGTQRPNNAC